MNARRAVINEGAFADRLNQSPLVLPRAVFWLVAMLLAAGCSTPSTANRESVADELHERIGRMPSNKQVAGDFGPLTAGRPLSEAEAVDLALANNAAFQEQLSDLGLTRADVVQAGLIANPDALILIPVGAKQLEATITAPLESLWLRGPRMDAAALVNNRNAARLVQVGLDLVRDVRLAYADAALARRRVELVSEGLADREKVADIAGARVRAGDAGPLDAATAKVELLLARRDVDALQFARDVADERLRALLGAGAVRTVLNLEPLPPDTRWADPDVEKLVPAALAGRPDLRAAELAAQSARLRASLARFDWINISFVADANERGANGFEAGPGFRFVLPIFNQNQGAIARADAELERATRARRTLVDRAILDVREAHIRYRQARGELTAWRSDVRPALEQAHDLARRAYERGGTPLVQVLDTNRQLLDAHGREAQAAADARRAWAELERSVGRRLDPPATRPTTQPIASDTIPAAPALRDSPTSSFKGEP